jgi:DNA-directed RNA polymerase
MLHQPLSTDLWARPKPFCATPYGQKIALEVFIDPLADFLAGKLPDKPHKTPTFLRPLIADLNDYRKLALMAVSPLLDCMTWDRDDPSAAAKLKLGVGAEMEAQLAFIAPWTEVDRLRAGDWLISQALALDLFDISDGFPKISAKWLPELDRIREEMIRAHPIHMPVFDPPPDWTGWWMGSPDRLRVPFVRRDRWPEHRAAITKRLKNPEWEHSKGVNALQRAPFKVDPMMRDLVERYAADIIGHVYQKRGDDERTVGDDIRTAKYLGDRQFYIPRNCDKRGRINSVCHFNFECGDHVRAMFKFANGMRLNREGTYWLEIHCANCEGSTDRKRREDRIRWVAEHRQQIQDIANDPFGTFDLWKDADSPFCFVAACRELAAAWNDPENFVTHLPVAFDGSANGLQHLALLIRDIRAAYMVNLIGAADDGGNRIETDPQDVYGIVIAKAIELLKADDHDRARWWCDRLELLTPRQVRKLLKQPIMTYSYSVTLSGATKQIAEAYGELRPNAWPDEGGFKYLAEKVLKACELLLPGPTKVMEYIRALAQHRMDQKLFLEWITPSGFPVLNRYHELNEPETINLKTYGVRVRHNIVLEFKSEIWETKTIFAAAANFVHSMDAAHLIRTVNSCVSEGITDILTVHDCFYFLAPQATRGREIVCKELGDLYGYNHPLTELRRRNVSDPSNPALFPVPPYGVGISWLDGKEWRDDAGELVRIMFYPLRVHDAENAFG